jgi:S-DNA-T family DNA segregation ATPase FtsK/SpoIIIE
MSDDDQGGAPEPTAERGAEDPTRTGRAVSARWRNRRRGVDAGALATQSAAFAAGIGRSVIGRRLAGGTVAVADSAGLPARPPAAAWRMSEVEEDRRVDTPMPPDLSSLRDLMRAREAARRPVRVDLPARGLPMVAALGVSSTAGPRTGPLAAGVRYQPRSAMVDRPPEVAAASPLANPIAPDYQSQPGTAIAAAPSAAPAEEAAPDDGLDALRRARAFREAQEAGERGGPGPADRDRPPPAGAAEALARAEAQAEGQAPAPAGDAGPDRRATPTAPVTPSDRPTASSSGRAGGIALATMLPLRRQRRLPTVPTTGPVGPSVAGVSGRVAGTAGLPVGSPVAVATTESGTPGTTAAVEASAAAASAPAAARAAAVRVAESGWQHWPTPAAALGHHGVDRRATGPSGPVTQAAARAAGAPGTASAEPAGTAVGEPVVATGPGTRWASGDAPPIALRPFGMLTGPRPHQTGPAVAFPGTATLAPTLRLVADDGGAATTALPAGAAAAPEVIRRTVAGAAGIDAARASVADQRRIAAAIAAGEAPGTPDARPSSTPTSTPTSTPRPASIAAGASAAPISSPGASPAAGVGFPHWPPPAGALARPLRPAAGVLRRRLAGAGAPFADAAVDVDAAAALAAGAPSRADAPGRTPTSGPHRPAASPASRATTSPSTRAADRPSAPGRRSPAGRPGASGPAGTAPPAGARWPHWPTPSGPAARGDQPARPHPVRPPAGAWAAPVDADIDLEPGGAWPGDRTEAPPRPARNHAEAAARFDDVLRRHRPDPLVDLPTPFVPLARALVGDRRVRVSVGRASREALAAAGHVAATVGTTIHLAQPLAPTAAHLDVVAHELTHVAAAPDRRGPRFFGDQEQDEEEGIADMIGRMARSILPASIGSLFGGGAPAAPVLPSALAAPPAPPTPALPAMPTMPGGIPGAPGAPPVPGIAATATPAPSPSIPPAPPLPAGAGTAGLPVGGGSGFLQALSGSLAPGATPAPRPTPQSIAGGASADPPSPPPPPPAPAGLAGAPTSLTPPPGSVQQAPATSVDGSSAEHVAAWGGAPAGRPRTAAELGFPGSVPLSVRDTTVSSPAVLEEAEIRRIVALIERRVLAELDRRGGRGNGLGGSW